MNTYLVTSMYDELGSFIESKIMADYFNVYDGTMYFYINEGNKIIAVAAFANNTWSRITKENK